MTTHCNTSGPPFKDRAQLLEALRAAIEQGAPDVIVKTHTFCGSGITPDILHGRNVATIVATCRGTKILCCGQDGDNELAQLKALMEFCERFACTHKTSNGYAAHPGKEQAARNAVLEVLERDACMRFWFNPTKGRVLPQDGATQQRAQALGQALQNTGVNSGSHVLLIAVQSKVPVVLAILLAKDPAQAPALIVGSGAGETIESASEKALCELEGYALNLIARQAQSPAWHEQLPKVTSPCPREHAQFYHHPHVRAKLKFLDYLLEQEPVALKSGKLEEVEADVKDVTPEMVRGLCYVVHATVAGCYPFAFGFPLPFTFECGQLSVAQELPHPFS